MFLNRLRLQTADGPRGLRTEQRRERFLEVTRGQAFEAQPGDQLLQAKNAMKGFVLGRASRSVSGSRNWSMC